MADDDNILRTFARLADRKPQTPEERFELARLQRLSSHVAAERADMQRPRIGLHSIPRDEHTRIRLRARAMVRSLPKPKLACDKDEVAED
jgi:hypothetical protein